MTYSRFVYWFILACLILVSCAPTESKKGQGMLDLKGYAQKLAELDPQVAEASGEALAIFENEFDKQDPSQNDLAFEIFRNFQFKVVEGVNNLVFSDDELADDLVRMAYNQGGEIAQATLDFNQKLVDNGLLVSAVEGSPFIDTNPEVVNPIFLKHLTKPAQGYHELMGIETLEPMSSDGGIIIPISELAERMMSWEKLLAEHSEFQLRKEAQYAYNSYLFFLIAGMDNTPPYDYETGKLNPEHITVYQSIIEKHPNSKSAESLKPLVDMLAKNDYKRTEESSAYIRKFSIWESEVDK